MVCAEQAFSDAWMRKEGEECFPFPSWHTGFRGEPGSVNTAAFFSGETRDPYVLDFVLKKGDASMDVGKGGETRQGEELERLPQGLSF